MSVYGQQKVSNLKYTIPKSTMEEANQEQMRESFDNMIKNKVNGKPENNDQFQNQNSSTKIKNNEFNEMFLANENNSFNSYQSINNNSNIQTIKKDHNQYKGNFFIDQTSSIKKQHQFSPNQQQTQPSFFDESSHISNGFKDLSYYDEKRELLDQLTTIINQISNQDKEDKLSEFFDRKQKENQSQQDQNQRRMNMINNSIDDEIIEFADFLDIPVNDLLLQIKGKAQEQRATNPNEISQTPNYTNNTEISFQQNGDFSSNFMNSSNQIQNLQYMSTTSPHNKTYSKIFEDQQKNNNEPNFFTSIFSNGLLTQQKPFRNADISPTNNTANQTSNTFPYQNKMRQSEIYTNQPQQDRLLNQMRNKNKEKNQELEKILSDQENLIISLSEEYVEENLGESWEVSPLNNRRMISDQSILENAYSNQFSKRNQRDWNEHHDKRNDQVLRLPIEEQISIIIENKNRLETELDIKELKQKAQSLQIDINQKDLAYIDINLRYKEMKNQMGKMKLLMQSEKQSFNEAQEDFIVEKQSLEREINEILSFIDERQRVENNNEETQRQMLNEIKYLQEKLENTGSSNSQRSSIVIELRNTLSRISEENEYLQQSVIQQIQQINNRNKTIEELSNLERNQSFLENEREFAFKEVQQLDERLNQLTENREKINQFYSRVRSQNENESKLLIEEKLADLNMKNQEIENIKNFIIDGRKEKAECEKVAIINRERMKEKVSQIIKNNTDLQDQIELLKKQSKLDIVQYTQQKEEIKRSVNEREKVLEALKKETDEYEGDFDTFEDRCKSDVQNLKEQKSVLDHEFTKIDEEKKLLLAQEKQLNQEFAKNDPEREKIYSQSDKLQSEVTQIRKQMAELNEYINELQDQIEQEGENVPQNLKNENQSQNEILLQLSADVENSQREHKMALIKTQELEKSSVQLRQEVQHLIQLDKHKTIENQQYLDKINQNSIEQNQLRQEIQSKQRELKLMTEN